MKIPSLDFDKLFNHPRALIINDDQRLNKYFFEIITNYFTKKEPEIQILYFPVASYVKSGFTQNVIWKYFQKQLELEVYKNCKLLVLVDGIEYLTNKRFHYRFSDTTRFYGIANSFVYYDNRNLFMELIPQFRPSYRYDLINLISTTKWSGFNHFLYHYCINLYEANNLVKMEQDWDAIVENLISKQIAYLKHKKINAIMLRKIIQEIATVPLGAFQIGNFCAKNDERYESVVLAINYLIEIKFLFEIKFILQNDMHSRKKQSLYFFAHNFIYFYYSHHYQKPILVQNVLLSQIIKDYWKIHNYTSLSLSYQYEKNNAFLKLKIGWQEVQLDLDQKGHNQIIFSSDLVSKIYAIESKFIKLELLNLKGFFSSKKLNLSNLKINTHEVNLFDYLQMISL